MEQQRQCKYCGSRRITTHEWFWYGEPSTNCKCGECGLLWPEFLNHFPDAKEKVTTATSADSK